MAFYSICILFRKFFAMLNLKVLSNSKFLEIFLCNCEFEDIYVHVSRVCINILNFALLNITCISLQTKSKTYLFTASSVGDITLSDLPGSNSRETSPIKARSRTKIRRMVYLRNRSMLNGAGLTRLKWLRVRSL